MQYRALPHGGEKLSVIGVGAGSLHNSDPEEIERIAEKAIDAGVNVFDFIPSKAMVLEPLGRALSRHRERVHVQVHIGACYGSGSYGWTTDAKQAIGEFEQRLKTLGTDYADFGFIHCIDEDADLDRVMNGGIWDYALSRKQDERSVTWRFPRIARTSRGGSSPQARWISPCSASTRCTTTPTNRATARAARRIARCSTASSSARESA